MPQSAARPFLKWVGGKSQLLDQFNKHFPHELSEGKISHYFEPFLGGGAVFFHLRKLYPEMRCTLSDINPRLIALYRTIREQPETLLQSLESLAGNYLPKNVQLRTRYFYERRKEFNDLLGKEAKSPQDSVRESALMIFLNRTCFNGLFRVNSQGAFNAPHGDYANPRIADPENLMRVSQALQKVRLDCASFEKTVSRLLRNKSEITRTFIYFDPPYRPISKTAHFTAYSGFSFGDAEQIKLAQAFKALAKAGAKVMLSNSDPASQNPRDRFFRTLYEDYNIHSVKAKRAINSKASKRGAISELIITNY